MTNKTTKRISLKQKIEFLAKNWITYDIVYGKSYDKSVYNKDNMNTDIYIITRKLDDNTNRIYTSKSLETAIKNLYNDINK